MKYFPLLDGEDGADNIFFNVDFNDGDRSWLTEILQEESVDSKSNSIASQCNSLMQIHKKKKLLGLNEEVSFTCVLSLLPISKDTDITENGTEYVLRGWINFKFR